MHACIKPLLIRDGKQACGVVLNKKMQVLRTELKLQLNVQSYSYASVNSSVAHLPPPPQATSGHLLTLSVPGVGHSQFYRGPGGWALAYPGATPGHLTMCFRKTYKFIGKDEAFVKDWLIRD